jgi:replicative DNA helicase Mcm
MIASIAPSIYGYDQEKLAMLLQLFSGVTKHLPDESRIRGDMHLLFIGDPGTGKCVAGDTKVTLADGSERAIGEVVESNLDDPVPVDDGVYDEVDFRVPSLDSDGQLTHRRARKVWKREAPAEMYRVRTASGREIEVTPSHPLFVHSKGRFEGVQAADLSEGQFVAAPRQIPTDGEDALEVGYRRSRSPNAIRLDLPDEWTPSLARLVGYVIAENYAVLRDDHTGDVRVTNNDREILDDVADTLDRLGLNHTERASRPEESARELMCTSGEFASFLAALEPSILERSAEQRVPNALMSASPTIKSAFVKALVESEGHVSTKEREIAVESMSSELLDGVRSLLLALGIGSQLQERTGGSFRLRISGTDFERYIEQVGFVTDRKSVASRAFDGTKSNTNTDVVANVGETLTRIREALALSQSACGLPRSTYQHYERGDRNPSRESLHTVLDTFEARLESLRETKRRVENGGWDAIETARGELNLSQQRLADGIGVTQTAVSYYERDGVVPDGGRVRSARDVALDRIDEALAVKDVIERLRAVADSDVAWDRIESIESVEPADEWVYDLEVERTHNYLTNNVLSHNSQLLQYIRHIAPRSVYTSGKGSSSAGLCVTGDTLIDTSDGFVPIADLARTEHPTPVGTDSRAPFETDLHTYDEPSGSVQQRTSSHVWRMPAKPCRRIETARGKELEASRNTPVLVCGESGIEWKAIGEIERGDHVATPKYTDIDRSSPPVSEYVELTNEKVRLDEDSIAFVREGLCDRFGTLREAAKELDLSEDFVYDSLRNRHVPLEKLDRLLDAIDTTREDVMIRRAMLHHGDSVRVPQEFNADLMYLLGLVFGDGDISVSQRGENRGLVRLSNGDESLLRRAAEIIESTFDKRVEIEHQDGKVPCLRLSSATVARLFANIGMETPKEDLALDEWLTTAEHADAFLQGLMDADGSVSSRTDGGSSVHFSTISEELARQVQLMLETYGVHGRTRERDRRGECVLESGQVVETKRVQTHLELFGRDIEAYADAIGFRSSDKQEALDEITGDAARRGETLPLGAALASVDGPAGQYYMNINRGDNPGYERARSMLGDLDPGEAEPIVEEAVDASLCWEEVVAVVDTGSKEVYDLTVPETHNFMANGIVTHNTAAAVRDDFGDGQQWTLEAGALVLADRGIAAVDEIDKMRCVTGDTLVHLGDGQVKRIRELAHEAASAGTVEELSNGRTIRGVDLETWTMTDDDRLVRRPVTAVHEYDAPVELTEATLESGETITATDDHPFFTLENGTRTEKPAAALESGEWVYVPRRLSRPAADGGTIAIQLSDDGVTGDLSPALGAVLGYLSGDGNVYYDRESGSYGVRFTNAEEELLSDFERVCCDAFDEGPVRPPSERRDDGVETVRLAGRRYADAILDAGMNLETYDRKAFPSGVTDAPTATKAAFIRALADSEGTVDTETGNVKIHSSSYELLLGTKSLLLEFGVSSQIQTRKRDPGRRDLYALVITAADSLAAYDRHVGFTLDRKQAALAAVCEEVSGDRAILDVVPECSALLGDVRESLRLYQSDCGLHPVTYGDFERGTANVSLHRARRVLQAFEERQRQATRDMRSLGEACSWQELAELTERYHVSQAELASGTACSQQVVSRDWGDDPDLREAVSERLRDVLGDIATTDLEPFRDLVRGDVKWRRVESVRSVPADSADDRLRLLRGELADTLGYAPDDAEDRARKLLADEPTVDSWEALRDELDHYGITLTTLADDLDIAGSTVSRWFRRVVETDRFDDVRAAALDRISHRRREVRSVLDELDARKDPKVYDLTVAGTHNFVANGMIVHNSEDRSAMHEALEQQSISVSKAGINATLKSRCSLLAAANPKYGRFDRYESVGEQIDLEPALISRFDLIFTVTDEPDPEEDANLADHILKTNYAGELNTQRTRMTAANVSQEAVDAATEEVAPTIDPDLLRKYIAYAKREVFPTMTEEARDAIRDFYVDLRAQGAGEDAPVPVTARKLEALVRLAEASARVRLSDAVELEDAERVIEIVRSCLKDIGVDPETGEFDADVVETGTSKSQRDRIKNIKALIEEIEEEYDEGAPIEEVLNRADEVGLDEGKAEHEIEQLKTRGELYEPRTDHLRTT